MSTSGILVTRISETVCNASLIRKEKQMDEYIPNPADWVREQVALYEGSGGTRGTALLETGLPCIIVTNLGNKTGGIRKVPFNAGPRTVTDTCWSESKGGAPKSPVWVYNLRANPDVEIRDETVVQSMRVREVDDEEERARLWALSVDAYPPYEEYQSKTTRKIPIFVAEPEG